MVVQGTCASYFQEHFKGTGTVLHQPRGFLRVVTAITSTQVGRARPAVVYTLGSRNILIPSSHAFTFDFTESALSAIESRIIIMTLRLITSTCSAGTCISQANSPPSSALTGHMLEVASCDQSQIAAQAVRLGVRHTCIARALLFRSKSYQISLLLQHNLFLF